MVNIARWKIILAVAISIIGLLYSAPNLLSQKTLNSVPSWLPHKHMSLGLDLRGGAHLLIEANLAVAIKDGLQDLRDNVRRTLRDKPRIGYRDLRVLREGITVVVRNAEDLSEARSRLRQTGLGMEIDTDGQQITMKYTPELLRKRKTAALQQAMEIVRRRIDESGLAEASVQRQGEDRILVQAPGVSNTTRLKARLGKTAKMTFHLLDPDFQTNDPRRNVRPGVMVLPERRERLDNQRPMIYYLVKKIDQPKIRIDLKSDLKIAF